MLVRLENAVFFGEFFGKGGLVGILLNRGGELSKIFIQPLGAQRGESAIEVRFEVGASRVIWGVGGLIINGASVHLGGEFHNRGTKSGIAI